MNRERESNSGRAASRLVFTGRARANRRVTRQHVSRTFFSFKMLATCKTCWDVDAVSLF